MSYTTIYCSALVLLLAAALAGCEKESWDLVSPPPNADSIMVRLVNLASDGQPYALQLDAVVSTARTQLTPPMECSPLVASPSDSAFIRVLDQSGRTIRDAFARTRFIKRTTETFVLLSSPSGSPRQQSVDTLVRLVTNPMPLPQPGRAMFRFFCAVPDTTVTFELRLGCPSGEVFDRQSYRGSSTPREIPAGEVVVSCLRGSEPLAIVRGTIRDRGFTTIIVTGTPVNVRVFLLDELDPTPGALKELLPVPLAERTAQVRWLNVSHYGFDSIRIASVGIVARQGISQYLSAYQQIPACTDMLSDTVVLYSNGIAQDAVPISLEVGCRYTLIVFDAPNFGVPASRVAVVVKNRTTITSDSSEWRVLNASSTGSVVTAFLGARLDGRGVYHNGENLASALDDGALSQAVRLPVGTMPIIVRTGVPERIAAVTVDTAFSSRQYTLIVASSGNGNNVLYSIADDDAEGTITPLAGGAYVQIVNAVADRALLTCSIEGVVRRTGLSPTNLVATILPPGMHTLSVGNIRRQLVFDPDRVVTVIAAGSGQSPNLIVLDSASLQPRISVARVRCINAAPDVAGLRVARDQLVSLDQWDSNIFANRLWFGFASTPIEMDRLQRINLVFGTADSPPVELLRPDGSVSFSLGRAYTIVFYGTKSSGYDFFIVQEP
ncbi:MAG: DUF4397 domain-containing protein [Chlorobi bacterium]|nr:DUF4397 domain-containing protein [Chlorobiota bacterium]